MGAFMHRCCGPASRDFAPARTRDVHGLGTHCSLPGNDFGARALDGPSRRQARGATRARRALENVGFGFPILRQCPLSRQSLPRRRRLEPRHFWTLDRCEGQFPLISLQSRMPSSRASAKASRRPSELFNPGTGAILVFLCGPTANAAGTDQDALAEDRHGALDARHHALHRILARTLRDDPQPLSATSADNATLSLDTRAKTAPSQSYIGL